jgi:hypothetical protein
MLGRRATMRRFALAVAVLCAMSLAGCAQVGTCGQAISVAPRITVDVSSWVRSHPDTNVRVCADGDCATGYNVVAFTEAESDPPPRDGDSIAVTAEAVHGSVPVESFKTTVPLVHDRCGQEGVWLRMDDHGRLTASA